MPNRPTQPPPIPRIDAIDFWRGFALLSIFVNHLSDNVFAALTHRNFGFSDAAELFVFLSGISVALAYGRRFLAGQVATALQAVMRRTGTIYGVQVAVSLAGIAMLFAAAAYFDDDDFIADPDRDSFVDEPLRGLLGVVTLGHQFLFFNILPLYIVLLLLTPALLVLARLDRRLMLAVAAALYGVTQLFALHLPSWPEANQWYFNPLAWQLLFALGLYVGTGIDRPPPRRLWLLVISLAVLIGSLVLLKDGFSLAPGLWDKVRETLKLDKTDLGLVRLLHFVALAYAAYHLRLADRLRATPIYRPLCIVGRHSLAVFATGAVLVVASEVLMNIDVPEMVSGTAIAVCGILLQYAVAKWLDSRAASRSLQPSSPAADRAPLYAPSAGVPVRVKRPPRRG